MKKVINSRILILVSCFAFTAYNASAQVARNSELFLTMQRHDSLFFEKCFNSCDTNYIKSAVHNDMIFFHDKAGIMNKADFIASTIKNLCSDWNNKPIRKVRKETLEVYPLYNQQKLYGVIQSGVHDFYIRRPNKPDELTGTAKFTHVYLLENGNWILREVLSYDH